MNRTEHLDWAKQRALEYLDTNDTTQALASMLSDLQKHPETQEHAGHELTGMLMMAGFLRNSEAVRKHIEGFN